MQRILKYGNFQNISLTPDKELNVLYMERLYKRVIFDRFKLLDFLRLQKLAQSIAKYCKLYWKLKSRYSDKRIKTTNEVTAIGLWPTFWETVICHL